MEQYFTVINEVWCGCWNWCIDSNSNMDNGADLWDFIGGWPVVNIHSIYKDQLGHLILVSGGNLKNLTRAICVWWDIGDKLCDKKNCQWTFGIVRKNFSVGLDATVGICRKWHLLGVRIINNPLPFSSQLMDIKSPVCWYFQSVFGDSVYGCLHLKYKVS